jgi:hypothetical protein
MTLLELAGRNRNQRDAILKLATAVLVLEDQITEKQDEIREQSVIEMNDEGVPMVSGFRDEALVSRLQTAIAVRQNNKGELQKIVDEIEAAFAAFGLPAMSMESLDQKINEASSLNETLARKINRLAVRLLNENPALTLPQLFANEELLAMETTRGRVVSEGLLESKRLISLKDQLLPLCSDGSVIAEDVFHPMRSVVTDPARIAEMVM